MGYEKIKLRQNGLGSARTNEPLMCRCTPIPILLLEEINCKTEVTNRAHTLTHTHTHTFFLMGNSISQRLLLSLSHKL